MKHDIFFLEVLLFNYLFTNLVDYALSVTAEKLLPNLRSQKFKYKFSPLKSSVVLVPVFRFWAIWFNFFMVWDRSSRSLFLHVDIQLSQTKDEQTSLSSLDCPDIPVGHQLSKGERTYFCALNSIPLIYMSTLCL
jgi:hypothetical protein